MAQNLISLPKPPTTKKHSKESLCDGQYSAKLICMGHAALAWSIRHHRASSWLTACRRLGDSSITVRIAEIAGDAEVGAEAAESDVAKYGGGRHRAPRGFTEGDGVAAENFWCKK